MFNRFSRNGKDFHSDKINIVNYNDKYWTNKRYKISVLISNAITPCFIVYSNDEVQALNELDEYCRKYDLHIFINHSELELIELEEDELEQYFQVDSGNYIDLSYVHIEEC